jgi:hypothetical protein
MIRGWNFHKRMVPHDVVPSCGPNLLEAPSHFVCIISDYPPDHTCVRPAKRKATSPHRSA